MELRKFSTGLTHENADKKWTQQKCRNLINYMQKNKPEERPTSQIYYTQFIKEYRLKNIFNWKEVRCKARHMRMTYLKTKSFCEKHENITEDEVLKKCSFFHELERVFDDVNLEQSSANSEPASEAECDSNTEPVEHFPTYEDEDIELKSEIEVEDESCYDVTYEVEPVIQTNRETVDLDTQQQARMDSTLKEVNEIDSESNGISCIANCDDTQKLKEKMSSLRQNLRQSISEALSRKRAAATTATPKFVKQNNDTLLDQQTCNILSNKVVSQPDDTETTNSSPLNNAQHSRLIENAKSTLIVKNANSPVNKNQTLFGNPIFPIKISHPMLRKSGEVQTVFLSASKSAKNSELNTSHNDVAKGQHPAELALRKEELELEKEKFLFEKEKYRDEVKRKKEESESQERIKIAEMQMKEKIAIKEMEMKERIALKEFEMKERLELEKFKLQIRINETRKFSTE